MYRSPHHTIVPKWSVFVSVACFCQLCLAVNVARCSSLLILVEYSALIMNLLDEGCFSRPVEKNSSCPAKDLKVFRFREDRNFARTILPSKWHRPKKEKRRRNVLFALQLFTSNLSNCYALHKICSTQVVYHKGVNTIGDYTDVTLSDTSCPSAPPSAGPHCPRHLARS